jgi:hypothetical protein
MLGVGATASDGILPPAPLKHAFRRANTADSAARDYSPENVMR